MGRFVVLGMENAVAATTATAASIALNEVPRIPTRQGGNAGLHQAGPRAGEVLSAGALFFRPQMAGGNRHQVDDYRVCCTIGVDGDPGGLNRNIRDFTGFTNANHKADVPGPLNEVQKTVAIVFAEDNPRQKLALMQGVPFKPARRQPVIALLLQPLQVGQVDGGISMLAILASICAAVLSSL